MNLCECGCGQELPIPKYPCFQRRFVSGHQNRGENNSMFGKHHRKETKKKIGDVHKGNTYNLGKHWKVSDEGKINMANAQRGRQHSEETKRKMSKSLESNTRMLGKHHSEATKRKISKSHLGEKNPMWRGGTSPLSMIVRNCSKSRKWIQDVFKRDDYICQICGLRSGEHNAHHIKSFAQILHENNIKTLKEAENCEEFWNVDNGITLCKECHKKEHCDVDFISITNRL